MTRSAARRTRSPTSLITSSLARWRSKLDLGLSSVQEALVLLLTPLPALVAQLFGNLVRLVDDLARLDASRFECLTALGEGFCGLAACLLGRFDRVADLLLALVHRPPERGQDDPGEEVQDRKERD